MDNPNGSVGAGSRQRAAPVIPTDRDVLFGRGRSFLSHTGNQALHALANEYRSLYKDFGNKVTGIVDRKQRYGVGTKQEIVDHMIGMLQAQGTRFLRRGEDPADDDGWYEVDLPEAQAKVSHLLRSRASVATATNDVVASVSVARSAAATRQVAREEVPSNMVVHRPHHLQRNAFGLEQPPMFHSFEHWMSQSHSASVHLARSATDSQGTHSNLQFQAPPLLPWNALVGMPQLPNGGSIDLFARGFNTNALGGPASRWDASARAISSRRPGELPSSIIHPHLLPWNASTGPLLPLQPPPAQMSSFVPHQYPLWVTHNHPNHNIQQHSRFLSSMESSLPLRPPLRVAVAEGLSSTSPDHLTDSDRDNPDDNNS